jgi:hypothetical protein
VGFGGSSMKLFDDDDDDDDDDDVVVIVVKLNFLPWNLLLRNFMVCEF